MPSLQQEVSIVNESTKNMTYNVYVSPKKKVFIYEYYAIYKILKDIKEILDKKDESLLEEEATFLSRFHSTFYSAKSHNAFILDPTDYLRLLNLAINAIGSRIEIESEKITKNKENIDERIKLHFSFYLCREVIEELSSNLFRDMGIIKDDPRRFKRYIIWLLDSVRYLIRTYFFYFEFEEDPASLDMTELEEHNRDMDRYWAWLTVQTCIEPRFPLELELSQ